MSATRPSADEIIERLEAGKLPQMVDWFDPLVLGMVGVRTLVSSTIGEYADQRPMQEAADGQRDMARLTRRHDFSRIDASRMPKVVLPPDADPNNPYCVKLDSDEYKTATPDDQLLFRSRHKRTLPLDGDALWVDFIADLGDGFEATYAMAHLMSKPEIEVPGATRKHPPRKLPAGQILIFGGDMAYPNATEEEYRTRCLEPYDWAFPFTPDAVGEDRQEPGRELFFIAGNHDWYDGLAAFSNQFCYETSAIGGWRCRQQRSYFALQLPYNWWIWGVDVALGDSLDVAQRHYFEAIVAKQVKPGDKIVIVQHAPDWFKHECNALKLICQLAREKGELYALIAGDLHHYSRYESVGRSPNLQLITSGGGGAFTHPTHDQKSTIRVHEGVVGGSPSDLAPKAAPNKKDAQKPQGLLAADRATRSKDGRVKFEAGGSQFYPTKSLSRLLALQNLALPLRNIRFALFMGVVYMIYAWVFQISVADPTVAIKQAHAVSIEMQCRAEHPDDVTRAAACTGTRRLALGKRLSDLTNPTEPALSRARQVRPSSGAAKDEMSDKVDMLISDVARQGGWWGYVATLFSVQLSPDRVLSGMLASPAFLFLVAGLWIALVQYAESDIEPPAFRWLAKLTIGTLHTAAHLTVLLAASSLFVIVYWFFADSHNVFVKVPGILLYTLLMIVIGGMLGAFVFGIYWVVTSMLFGMHPDSFSALGIKDYRNFLRMKFEPNRLTIYPVALDLVPGRYGWKSRDKADVAGSLIQPKNALKPRLIEGPIVISRSSGAAAT
jgi:Calcineurin-like phosphoesterase